MKLILALLLVSVPGFAAEAPFSSVENDWDGDGKSDLMALYSAPTEDDEALVNLSVIFGNGHSFSNKTIAYKAGLQGPSQNPEDFGSSLKLLDGGKVELTELKDWGTNMYAIKTILSLEPKEKKNFLVSEMTYTWAERDTGGECHFDFSTGDITVNDKIIDVKNSDRLLLSENISLHIYLDICRNSAP